MTAVNLNHLKFYGNYSILDSHTNIVISHTFAYSSRWRGNPDMVYYLNRFTGTCVFEISRPNQTDIINLAHFCVNKTRLQIIQNIGCFCIITYFNKIKPNLVCQALVGRLIEVTTMGKLSLKRRGGRSLEV